MQRFLFYIFFLILSVSCIAQNKNRKLQDMLQAAITDFKGDIGIYIKNLKTGKAFAINADTVFPTASIVKVPILLGITEKMIAGEYKYDSVFVYNDSLLYPGEDILGQFKNGGQISLKKLIMLMLTTSDNTASLWLQKLSGGGIRINQILDSLGYKNTRVNSRTPGREKIREVYGWGQTTPREMASLFEKIYQHEIFTPADCDRMMRCLGRNFWDIDEGISQIPPNIQVFSKNGCVDQSRNEVMLVNAPHNPYIFSLFTKNNKDDSWTHENEAWVLTRKIAAILWKYFEPDNAWKAPIYNPAKGF